MTAAEADEALDPTDPETYKFWNEAGLRFNDLDFNRHVNNTAFGILVEDGRVALFGAARAHNAVSTKGSTGNWVVRKMEIEYLHELRYPGTVRIGTRLVGLGTSSVRFYSGIFDHTGKCVCTAKTIGVYFDLETRKSKPIPDYVRIALQDASDGKV